MSLGICCLSFCTLGLGASQKSGDFVEPSSIAIGLFNQGYRHCQAAHRQRSRDIEGAQRKFQLYLDYLAQAKVEDARVVSTSVDNIDRNIAYCNQVAVDLTRATANPYLEKSYLSCNTARRFVSDLDVLNAEKYFDAHIQLKAKALHMSPDLLSRTLGQTWTQEGERLCKRVKLNIQRLGNRLARINLEIPVVEKYLSGAVEQCSAGRKGVLERASPDSLQLILRQVKSDNGKAKAYSAVWQYAHAKGKNDASALLLKSLANSSWCEHKLGQEIVDLIDFNRQELLNKQLRAEQEALAKIQAGEADEDLWVAPGIGREEALIQDYEMFDLELELGNLWEERPQLGRLEETFGSMAVEVLSDYASPESQDSAFSVGVSRKVSMVVTSQDEAVGQGEVSSEASGISQTTESEVTLEWLPENSNVMAQSSRVLGR